MKKILIFAFPIILLGCKKSDPKPADTITESSQITLSMSWAVADEDLDFNIFEGLVSAGYNGTPVYSSASTVNPEVVNIAIPTMADGNYTVAVHQYDTDSDGTLKVKMTGTSSTSSVTKEYNYITFNEGKNIMIFKLVKKGNEITLTNL